MAEIRAAILGEPGTWHGKALLSALEQRRIKTVYADPTLLNVRLGDHPQVGSDSLLISDLDLLLVREIPGGTLEQIIFRMDALHQVENGGVRVVNSPYAIEKMVDKYYTLSLLGDAGLPVPETLVTENFTQAMEAYRALGGDVVIKPLFGSRGVGMVRVADAETAGRVFKALQLGGYVYYLQEFVPHANRDIRVFVVGEESIAAMERISDSWKTNIAGGGRPVHLDLTPDISELSQKAAKVLGADYCGVDLVRNSSTGGLFVLEANSMPAWEGLQQVTPFDIAGRIADHCLKICKKR